MNVIRTPAGKLRRRAAIGAVGLAALGGGGAAIAATKDAPATPAAQTTAIATDAAGQLGVTPAALTAAIKKAMVDQIEAQVTAGTITKAQAAAMEARLDQGRRAALRARRRQGRPRRRPRPRRPRRRRPRLARRRSDLHRHHERRAAHAARGRQDARDHRDRQRQDGRRPQGRADHGRHEDDLDAAVKAGKLTQAQEDKILAALPARLDDEINETHTGGPGGGHGGPPPADAPPRPRAGGLIWQNPPPVTTVDSPPLRAPAGLPAAGARCVSSARVACYRADLGRGHSAPIGVWPATCGSDPVVASLAPALRRACDANARHDVGDDPCRRGVSSRCREPVGEALDSRGPSCTATCNVRCQVCDNGVRPATLRRQTPYVGDGVSAADSAAREECPC